MRVKLFLCLFIVLCSMGIYAQSKSDNSSIKIIFIRHGEKPANGDNLTCKGLNRALQLPVVITSKFGKPDYLYVPKLNTSITTTHARMFETAVPLAVKYNLAINSSYEKKEADALASELKKKTGTILVVWEHKAIAPIVQALGISTAPTWADDDYDSIWIVTIMSGTTILSLDKEGLHPAEDCP